ncbi:MAG: DUF1905 domain-containing protein [Chitinophagaceae bacterium]|nr:DUF1905 domain-containing protein [Chitinophagaceae bacterium]
MISFKAILEKFAQQGEKTGWTYIHIPFDLAEKINPGQRKAYRVKGQIDEVKIEKIAMMPMGEGNYILPLKAGIRKQLRKSEGAEVMVQLKKDDAVMPIHPLLMECLNDEPDALNQFNTLTPSHQRYFSNYVQEAKTDATQAKRIAQILNAMIMKWNYAEMIRAGKKSF